MRDAIVALVEADGRLAGLLSGGVHTGEISRQSTPDAFDANGELLPCALVRIEGEAPVGPYQNSTQQFIVVTLYQQSGTDIIDTAVTQLFSLLHRVKLAWTWECRWVGDVRDIEDEALRCSMTLSRFQITRLREGGG